MKRVLTFLAIMLLPLSVMAMTPVSDADLADVTGQAGVSINADLTMNIAIGTMAWGDATGLDVGWDTGYAAIGDVGNDAGGYVGMTGFNINNLQLRARETDTWNGYYEADHLKPITIDVATGGDHPGVTFVRFGLGSLEISMNSFDFDVMLGTDPAAMDQKLGDVYLGNIRLFINPGSYVDIYNGRGAGTSGVTMDMYVLLDRFEMSVVSWGDSDGLQLTTLQGTPGGWIGTSVQPGAGYIGLENLVIDGTILVDGAVSIDVATVSNGKYILDTDWHSSDIGRAVVHITLGESGGDNFLFAVNGAITANVKLDATAALNGGTSSTLGDIYISGFNVEILGGSWVDIWAH